MLAKTCGNSEVSSIRAEDFRASAPSARTSLFTSFAKRRRPQSTAVATFFQLEVVEEIVPRPVQEQTAYRASVDETNGT
jgi:hypothetical protein